MKPGEKEGRHLESAKVVELSTDRRTAIESLNEMVASLNEQFGDSILNYSVSIGVAPDHETAIREWIDTSVEAADGEELAAVVHPHNQRPTDPSNGTPPTFPGGFTPITGNRGGRNADRDTTLDGGQ